MNELDNLLAEMNILEDTGVKTVSNVVKEKTNIDGDLRALSLLEEKNNFEPQEKLPEGTYNVKISKTKSIDKDGDIKKKMFVIEFKVVGGHFNGQTHTEFYPQTEKMFWKTQALKRNVRDIFNVVFSNPSEWALELEQMIIKNKFVGKEVSLTISQNGNFQNATWR